jgi:hypothetical protein
MKAICTFPDRSKIHVEADLPNFAVLDNSFDRVKVQYIGEFELELTAWVPREWITLI